MTFPPTLGSCSTSGEPRTGVRDCCSARCADSGFGVTSCRCNDTLTCIALGDERETARAELSREG